LFSLEPVIEDSFKKLEGLMKEHSDDLVGKGFRHKGNEWYKTSNKHLDTLIITDIKRAIRLAQEAHIRLGHRNAQDTLIQLRMECHFPYMLKIIEDVIENCTACQFCANNSDWNKMPMQFMPRKGPFVTWGMDFVGPLPTTSHGNQYLATAIDYGTGWTYAVALKARSGIAVVKLVKHIIETHGFPHSITTNNGSKFNGKVFQGFLQEHKIKHNKISPYHPQSNGLVKQFHGTLIGSLRKY
jgi:hypothetical protein